MKSKVQLPVPLFLFAGDVQYVQRGQAQALSSNHVACSSPAHAKASSNIVPANDILPPYRPLPLEEDRHLDFDRRAGAHADMQAAMDLGRVQLGRWEYQLNCSGAGYFIKIGRLFPSTSLSSVNLPSSLEGAVVFSCSFLKFNLSYHHEDVFSLCRLFRDVCCCCSCQERVLASWQAHSSH